MRKVPFEFLLCEGRAERYFMLRPKLAREGVEIVEVEV